MKLILKEYNENVFNNGMQYLNTALYEIQALEE